MKMASRKLPQSKAAPIAVSQQRIQRMPVAAAATVDLGGDPLDVGFERF
ncbi:hypothetical protein [Geomesophilobacter sediminis]|uniref:Anacyclamide/piricyclamide family prenylated cyclic peptide n=1 Tax=Geomesophilobacter sediminis TaxID=2798584 RepID=A0A8J7M146_9BACT|nr:hypothetical protein [Geomesophilobacter sediminis]MBJ6726694.1 hypothetical protein [Geomesophilobacter sediminis]